MILPLLREDFSVIFPRILNSEFQKCSLFSEYGSTTGTGPVKEREHAAA